MKIPRHLPKSTAMLLLACAMVLQVMILAGCRSEPSAPAEAPAPSAAPAPSPQPAPSAPAEQPAEEPRLSWTEQEHLDSLRLAALIASALDMTLDSNTNRNFEMSHKEDGDDGIPRSASAQWNHHFTAERRHLIVQVQDPNTLVTEIYLRERNQFRRLLSHRQWQLTHISDSIWDVNGDGRKDIVFNGYGANGCCLKAFSEVYLQAPGGKSFSEQIHFLNPTFSPREHVVRGVCYGHPGHTPVYKYRWDGTRLDTVEYVQYERDSVDEKTGFVLISKDESATVGVRRVKEVPAEYLKIEGFNWFSKE